MKFFSHPLWLVGFRPFFTLACLSGLLLPSLWLAMLWGVLPAPLSVSSGAVWHAHEMFFGFGWALLAGFLLTATKNWVGIRGYHGAWLAFLAGAWLLDRLAMAFGGAWPRPLFFVAGNLYLVCAIAMILGTLIRYRRDDPFKDNVFFILALPLFPPAKYLLLSEAHFTEGWLMTLGLFRLAILIMLERTTTQFMGVLLRADILRDKRLDWSVKGVALVLVFAGFMPESARAWLSLLLALLAGGRLLCWKPRLACTRLDVGIMHLGYGALVAALLMDFVSGLFHPAWVGSASTHLFTLGALGLLAPAIMVRISKGHTGRQVLFAAPEKAVLYLMMLALFARVLAPQFLPAYYLHWLALAALSWFAGYSLLAWRVVPILFLPRADGKEH